MHPLLRTTVEGYVPDCVAIAPGAVAPGFGVELVGARIVLDHVSRRAFFYLDALVAARRDRVSVNPVSIASILPVLPLIGFRTAHVAT